MQKILITVLSLSVFISSCQGQQKVPAFKPAAVIELFTSEGCSSCPPADKLLAKYNRDSVYEGMNLFTLAFHVDYWNYLGWRDSFSTAQYSDRQKMYVDALGLNGAYTPQMIVNGIRQFTGSDESALQEALSAATKKGSLAAFTGLKVTRSGQQLKVQYSLQGGINDCEIHFALVSLFVTTAVKRGENQGRKLEHTNVVRQFITAKANTSGETAFENIAALPMDNIAVIAYVQQSQGQRVVAAAEVKP